MNIITYEDANNLPLPAYVIQSLRDRAELAHIRHLEALTYIILNYPSGPKNIHPVCVATDGETYNLYAHTSVLLNDDTDAYSFTDLIIQTLRNYETLIKYINAELNHYEELMDRGITKENIRHLFSINRQLIQYQTAINAIGDVTAYIRDQKPSHLWSDENASEYANIRIEINQLDQNIEMYQQIIESIVSVSDSLFSNKLNITMKRLTSITLVLSIPTLITSFYGMNIDLPFQDHPYSLAIVFVISTLLTIATVAYLYRKDFF
ncbi:magnesium transporter CorA family protein [Erysipelothrix sp. HDW6C]|uniref:magnesium transporter CorA family protein n=1 Tax=Erysipelothrix sp. HDW6C TaxID=2714930 RepID=UPI001407A263|nr:magnesium transporter CorA family protein [Erysipelothrix sp. HDW6C]QIK69771.1 magnesium transporter CorA family protein [Erysipelothrix sp. HDW6C]